LFLKLCCEKANEVVDLPFVNQVPQ